MAETNLDGLPLARDADSLHVIPRLNSSVPQVTSFGISSLHKLPWSSALYNAMQQVFVQDLSATYGHHAPTIVRLT
ncbi:hypothetical protein Tco_0715578 [Tanacetum coccineum]